MSTLPADPTPDDHDTFGRLLPGGILQGNPSKSGFYHALAMLWSNVMSCTAIDCPDCAAFLRRKGTPV